jgi:malonate-semialdehyde dehydrogenase (acetylating) / methylmalonate-semialdehyde dehydrogenase
MTMNYVAELMHKAGIPKGIFQIVNGAKPTVEALLDHKQIKAITFVGSSPVADIVSKRAM